MNGVKPNAPNGVNPKGTKLNGVKPKAPKGVKPKGVNPNAPKGVNPNGVNPNAPNGVNPNGVNPNAPNGTKLNGVKLNVVTDEESEEAAPLPLALVAYTEYVCEVPPSWFTVTDVSVVSPDFPSEDVQW